MTVTEPPPTARLWLPGLVVWGLAFALACELPDAAAPGGRDILLLKAIGAARFAVSARLFEAADHAFHKGVGPHRKEAFSDWFVTLRHEAIPSASHAHREGEEVREIVPWLHFATLLDPRNVTAYTVAAYWLGGAGGRPDLAEQVLREGQRHNPRDYRLYLARGRLALKQAHLDQAARLFDAGLRVWSAATAADEAEARMDRAELLTYRGLLHETEGAVGAALALYREGLALFPERAGLRRRVDALEKGETPTPPAADLWQTMLAQHRHVCAAEETEEDGHTHADAH